MNWCRHALTASTWSIQTRKLPPGVSDRPTPHGGILAVYGGEEVKVIYPFGRNAGISDESMGSLRVNLQAIHGVCRLSVNMLWREGCHRILDAVTVTTNIYSVTLGD